MELDPALMVNPDAVLARLAQRGSRPRPFALRGPVDPATDDWKGSYAPTYAAAAPSWWRRIGVGALILIAGSGLGVAVAGMSG